ncbi:hypothetical protein [Sphingobacterium multivorum]|uniref:hypothetical protein n=1 Tax=Sphingobacterium multivorum TaxID=28454 RepID=UPI003DA6195C
MNELSPYEYYNGKVGVRLSFIVSDDDRRHHDSISIFSYSAYEKRARRIEDFRLRKGLGRGNDVLITFSKLSYLEQQLVIKSFGDPDEVTPKYQFKSFIQPDDKALVFYSAHKLKDGRRLKSKVVLEYTTNAQILNACHTISTNNAALRRALNNSADRKIWDKFAECIQNLDKKEYPHTLPGNPEILKRKYRNYKKDGYMSLIHKGFCNDNSRVVTFDIERLILSLYIQSNNPYVTEVYDNYMRFLAGDIDIYDYETGEIYDRNQFYENGLPITLSEATIRNYVNQPTNRAIVDKFRMDSLTYQSVHEPHVHRHHARFSLSKISMDDRDLPRKMTDGKRVKAYYAYDVTSGCIIGASYSRNKTTELFIDCLRDMFRFLDRKGFGMPMQAEVEHHLVNNYKDDMMKAGVLFPFVRWANAGNSQEKWAETGNRLKKYGYEKRYQDGIGRWYAKNRANKTKVEKVFDEANDTYKEKTYTYDRLVDDDMDMVEKYNNGLHPNQKKYKDMTRMQVLEMCVNQNLANIDRPLLTKFIGEPVDTTIRRNQYVQVKYAQYILPSPDIIDNLAPGNYSVKAYYLKNDLGEIEDVYLYQNEVFLCKATKIETFNDANAEWEDDDKLAYTDQMKYISGFRKKIKEGKGSLGRIRMVDSAIPEDIPIEVVTETAIKPNLTFEDMDFELPNPEQDRLNAINSL